METKDQKRSDYFQSIARHFFKLRGAPFFLSSKELDLVARWEEMGIPLPVVLEGIESSFASLRIKQGRKLKIQSLAYCTHHVLRAFEQHRDRRVGSRKEKVEREEKRKRAKTEVRKFLLSLPLQVNYLKEPYSRAQKLLGRKPVNEEELEWIEEEVEGLIWKNSSEREKEAVKEKLRIEHRFENQEEFQQAFKIKVVKVLREKHRIPYISLFYY